MTDNEKKAKMGEVLEHYVRWYNALIDDGILPCRGENGKEMNFRMWLNYNHKEAVEMFGFDLLYRNLQLCVSQCGSDDTSAWTD